MEEITETLQKLLSFRQNYNRAVKPFAFHSKKYTQSKRLKYTTGFETSTNSPSLSSQRPEDFAKSTSALSQPCSTRTLCQTNKSQSPKVVTSKFCSANQRVSQHLSYTKTRFVGIPRQVQMRLPVKSTNYLISKDVLDTVSCINASLKPCKPGLDSGEGCQDRRLRKKRKRI